jgi:hypothetical protein
LIVIFLSKRLHKNTSFSREIKTKHSGKASEKIFLYQIKQEVMIFLWVCEKNNHSLKSVNIFSSTNLQKITLMHLIEKRRLAIGMHPVATA